MPALGTPRLEDIIRSEELAVVVAEAAADKKAQDVVALDMRGLVAYTDIFVLCTASNRRQVKAIADHVRQHLKKEYGHRTTGVEGLESGRWALVDFGDVVLHIFEGPLRGFYDLDGLWSDAPRIPLPLGDVDSEATALL